MYQNPDTESSGAPVKVPDRVFKVDVGDGAAMTLPLRSWVRKLRIQRIEPPRGTLADDRLLAAGVIESLLYLVNCPRDEAWRRVKLLRAAMQATPDPEL